MSRTFTKLFSSITESTVWCEPDRTRLLWICMLAMADRNGRVWGSVPGLANRARIPVEDARTGIETFLGPDLDSRTPDFEGRRIEAIDGGWRLLNHEKYRAIRDEEATKESKRNYINARRAKEREGVEQSRTESNTVVRGRDNAEADTDAEAIKEKRGARGSRLPETWEPGTEGRDFALSLGIGGKQFQEEAAKFCDYWRSQAGQKGLKTDWLATWRNWCRNAKPQGGPRSGETSFTRDRKAQAAAWMGTAAPQSGEVIDMEASDAARISLG